MNKQLGNSQKKNKPRYAVEFGALLRTLLRYPPHREPPRELGFFWKPDAFGLAIGRASGSAVRQWLRGEYLPEQFITGIIRVLFGPNPDQYADQVIQLMKAFERGQDLRDGRNTSRDTEFIRKIPRLAPNFMGRDNERDTLVEKISSGKRSAILIRGGPGIGKTELTKAIADHPDALARFGDRRWFIALDAATDIRGILNAFGNAMGTDPNLGVNAIVARIRSAPTLLILDNIDTPWTQAEARDDVEEFLAELAATPQLAIIASQRGSEPIPSLAWSRILNLEALDNADAATLFLKTAKFENPTDPFFAKFTQALGGLPLAIVLVALRAHGHSSLKKLWSEWVRIGTSLASQPSYPNIDQTRLTSLTASIELSLNSPTLTERAKRFFAILGRTPDGLSEQERNEVMGEDSFELEESLCRVGLAFERSDRVTLLPPIREFASRLPLARDDNLCWTRCVLGPARELRDDASTSYEENFTNFQRLSKGLNNIESSISYLIESDSPDELERYLDGLIAVSQRFGMSVNSACRLRDYFSENENYCARGKTALVLAHVADRVSHLELADISFKIAVISFENASDERALISALLQYGEYQNRRERHRGRHHFLRARDISRRVDDGFSEVNANVGLAMASLMDSSYSTARVALEESCLYYQTIGLGVRSAECSDALAKIYEIQSLNEAALQHYEYAESEWRDHGFKANLAKTLVGKAGLYVKMLKNEIAQQVSAEALEIFTSLGDEKGIANSLYRRATLTYYQGHGLDAAETDLERAEEIYARTDDKNGMGHCSHFRALAVDAREDPDLHREFLASARGYFRAAGNACERAQCSYELASLAFLQGRYDEMATLLTEALPEFSQRGDIVGAMNCELLFADLYLAGEEFKIAEDLLVKTLNTSREIGSQFHEAQALQRLANIFSKHQRHNEAKAAYRQAATLYQMLAMADEEAICLNHVKSYDYE